MKILLEQVKCGVNSIGDGDKALFPAVYNALVEKISEMSEEHRELLAIINEYKDIPEKLFNATNLRIVRKTLDARKKSDLKYIYSVIFYYNEEPDDPCESSLYSNKQKLSPISETAVQIDKSESSVQFDAPLKATAFSEVAKRRPIIVGFGPAGIFAGLYLATKGLRPIIIERGNSMEFRIGDVNKFWNDGILSPESNVQFGEGGAGAFSDGKLTTGIKDSLLTTVLQTFVDAGAPEDILYNANPHIGTDIIRAVVVRLRKKIIELGGEVRFNTRLVGISLKNETLNGLTVDCKGVRQDYETDCMILATGHSARDTVRMLYKSGLGMEAKPFALGLRIEHFQEKINKSQFGLLNPDIGVSIGPASYKLVSHLKSGRSVYTFCMCPGGQVIAGSSGQGQVVTNGMSYHARNGINANSALLVNVNPEDFRHLQGDEYDEFFGSEYFDSDDLDKHNLGDTIHPLNGFLFQAAWEHRAFVAGSSSYRAPAQYLEEFLYTVRDGAPKVVRVGNGVTPTYKPGVVFTDIGRCIPDFIGGAIWEALPDFNNKIKGFASPGAVLTGIESRSSSPVRILRDSRRLSDIGGVIPCGEGSGYAGGIMSASIDGIRCAMSCIENFFKDAVFKLKSSD